MFPQLFYIFLILSTLAFWALKHGEPQSGTRPGGIALALSYALVVALYAWGGFFAVVGWPEYVMLGFLAMNIAYDLALEGKPQPDYNFWRVLSLSWVSPTLLYFGGFFDPLLG